VTLRPLNSVSDMILQHAPVSSLNCIKLFFGPTCKSAHTCLLDLVSTDQTLKVSQSLSSSTSNPFCNSSALDCKVIMLFAFEALLSLCRAFVLLFVV